MANLTPLTVLLVAIFSTGLAARLDITTTKMGNVTKTEIQCRMGQFDRENRNIEEIGIIGPDRNTVLANVTPSNLSPIVNQVPTANMQSHGQIDNHDLDKSYLSLTLYPTLDIDNGLYSCHIHYGIGSVSQIAQAANTLDIEKQDMQIISKYLMKQINTLNREMEEKDEELAKEYENILRLTNMITALEKKVKTIEENQNKNQAIDNKQDGRIDDLSERAKYNVAFRARYKYKYTFVTGDILKFGIVDLNIGNAYSGNTGIFTAPRDGVYYFSVIANYPYYGRGFSIYIKADNKIVAAGYTYDKDWHNSVVVSATIECKKGHQVKVTVRDATGRKNLDNDTELSVFTGHLVNLL